MYINFTDFIIFLVFFLLMVLWKRSRRPLDCPPGPTPIPIIGNIHNIGNGKTLLNSLRELRMKYGDIFSLSIGQYLVIVVNELENIREILVENAEFTSDKPQMYFTKVLNNKGILGTNGHLWREQRKFTLSKLHGLRVGNTSFITATVEEVETIIKVLSNTNGKSFSWQDILSISMMNVFFSVTIGQRFDHNDPELLQFVKTFDEFILNPAMNGPVNFVPASLATLQGDPFKVQQVSNKMKLLQRYIRQKIDNHSNTFDPGNLRDFIDDYLKKMRTDVDSDDYSVDQLVGIILDLLAGGSYTTSTTIKWAIIYPIRHPNIQEKMRNEIDSTVGIGRAVSILDRPNLPYCEAVINETLRLGNIIPITPPRLVLQDITCKGFRIPEGSVLMPMIDSVLYDEQLFPGSTEFRPERFIDQNGKLCNKDRLVVFSLGRRACLGEHFARKQLFLYLTNFVQRFEFLPNEEEGLPEVESVYGLFHGPVPYTFRAICR